jgi:hypothetical protein
LMHIELAGLSLQGQMREEGKRGSQLRLGGGESEATDNSPLHENNTLLGCHRGIQLLEPWQHLRGR